MYYSASTLISDIELQLNQGAISDDSELSKSQIAFWIEYELNSLVQQECEISMKQGKPIPAVYITRASGMRAYTENYVTEVTNYSAIPAANPSRDYEKVFKVKTEETVNGITYPANSYYKLGSVDGLIQNYIQIGKSEAERKDLNERMMLNLSNYKILNISKDSGIVRLLTDEYELINKCTTEYLDTTKDLRFAGPSADKLIWYRQSDFLYLEGMSDPEVQERYFIMDYVAHQSVSEESSLYMTEAILPILIDRVAQRGKMQMYGTTPDIANDGVDNKQSVYHTAIANPSKDNQTQQQ